MPVSRITIGPDQREALSRNISSDVYCSTNLDPESLGPEDARRLMRSLRVLEALGWTTDASTVSPREVEVTEPEQLAPVLHHLIGEVEEALRDEAREIGVAPGEVDPEWSEDEGAHYLAELKRRADRLLDDRSELRKVLAAIEEG